MLFSAFYFFVFCWLLVQYSLRPHWSHFLLKHPCMALLIHQKYPYWMTFQIFVFQLIFPPISKSVKSNIRRIFLRLLSKHFPQNHTMHKIFNRNTVKISYSCLRNISSIISSHNHNILSPKQESFGCNCRVKNECPLWRVSNSISYI